MKMDGVNIMLDLETLGTSPGCGITQVGAVVFDETGVSSDPLGCFQQFAEYDHESGLHVSGGTLRFWFDQALLHGVGPLGKSTESVQLDVLLVNFGIWLARRCPNPGELRLWCHATFDLPVLEAAYRAYKMKPFWGYRVGRDVRTILNLANIGQTHEVGEVEHDSLDDARTQARAVVAAFAKLREGNPK